MPRIFANTGKHKYLHQQQEARHILFCLTLYLMFPGVWRVQERKEEGALNSLRGSFSRPLGALACLANLVVNSFSSSASPAFLKILCRRRTDEFLPSKTKQRGDSDCKSRCWSCLGNPESHIGRSATSPGCAGCPSWCRWDFSPPRSKTCPISNLKRASKGVSLAALQLHLSELSTSLIEVKPLYCFCEGLSGSLVGMSAEKGLMIQPNGFFEKNGNALENSLYSFPSLLERASQFSNQYNHLITQGYAGALDQPGQVRE